MWRRSRLWLLLLVVVVLGGILVGTLADHPGRPLDPTSAHKNGSKALVRLLERYGVTVTATSSLDTAVGRGHDAAVVVTAPDEYSDVQLRRLSGSAARLVLAAPDSRTGQAIATGLRPSAEQVPVDYPMCIDPGASAAGRADLPGDAVSYDPGETGATSCYGGALLVTPQLAVLGSASLLRNDELAHGHNAALDINAITDSRRLTSVVWLLPGADATGAGAASLWDVFPSGAYRVFWWALAVGLLVTVWRARRLGGVVPEPLPVVVHAAEVVEGHGRLYARAGARDRAAAALRKGAVTRLGRRLGLPPGASAEQIGVAVAPAVGRTPAEVVALLSGPPPADDLALLRLTQELDTLAATVGGPTEGTP